MVDRRAKGYGLRLRVSRLFNAEASKSKTCTRGSAAAFVGMKSGKQTASRSSAVRGLFKTMTPTYGYTTTPTVYSIFVILVWLLTRLHGPHRLCRCVSWREPQYAQWQVQEGRRSRLRDKHHRPGQTLNRT
ncbi:hypothetical protein BDW22DRAFT_1069438 [Trametopsis cervina]|nr:hypothetical protein BDW22DRAFT_1069438 [Trametopsis cervina]